MKRLFKSRYPKITILILCTLLAYIILSDPFISGLIKNLGNWGYLSIFIAGMFFTFGFTTPFAIGFFIVLQPDNIFLAAIVGGFGALISDLFIFRLIRFSFMDEFLKLEKTEPLQEINHLLDISLSHRIKNYFMYAFAGLIIASPLPDEVGITMLAGLTRIKTPLMAAISIIFNTLGILVMLLI